MLTGGRSTLTQFLIEERRRHPTATGELNALITDVSLACKAIARKVAFGTLSGSLGTTGAAAYEGSAEPSIEQFGNAIFLRTNEWGGHVAGMLSKQLADAYALPAHFPRGKYLLLFDALDGSSNADVNVAVGSIFSVLHAPHAGVDALPGDFLQAGASQVCAGYAIYGPATMLVLTLGSGTHGFTLEPLLGEWVLSHPRLQIPARTQEFAINASNARFWEPPVKRYVDECLAGASGERRADFNMRWIASLVAETHRILMRGGIFMNPRDVREPAEAGSVHLLYQANPIALLIEEASGATSTGRQRVLDLVPQSAHERVGFVFGSAEEVARIESYHREDGPSSFRSPLFAERGLFATHD